jgi:ribonuclease-3
MNFPLQLQQATADIEARIGYTFANKELLHLAFVHRSYLNENRSLSQHNERQEFLGDAVLGLLIAEYLYTHYPQTPEGELSFLRSRLVEAGACARYVQVLHLESHLLLGRGERLNDGKGRHSILADFFEALIGAIYLDGGMEAARRFLFEKFHSVIDTILAAPWHNWKALLQDLCQKTYQETPTYTVLDASGPDHSKNFTVAVAIRGHVLGSGSGSSKKEAQQSAAAEGLNYLQSEDTPKNLPWL